MAPPRKSKRSRHSVAENAMVLSSNKTKKKKSRRRRRRSSSSSDRRPDTRSLDVSAIPEHRDPIANQTGFALRLAMHVAPSKAAAGANLVLSPLSIHVMLSLVAAGSKGPTLDQFLSILQSGGVDELRSLSSEIVPRVLSDGSASGGPRLSSVNGGWLDSSISLTPSFMEIATSDYNAEVKIVNFRKKAEEVRCEVNSWAENETGGLVKELLPPRSVDDETRLVLANALHFKGVWRDELDASKTIESEFHLLDGSSVRVPFMAARRDQLLAAYDGFKVLELRYEQGKDKRRFSLCVFLPDARDGLRNLEARLSSGSRFLDRHLPRKLAKVGRFMLPRFKVSFGLEASEVLKELGLVLPFTEQADLTGMSSSRLCVSSVFHRSVVEVDEEGTEAAAATAVMPSLVSMGARRPPRPRLDFEADHPFVFLIREGKSGVVLFVGHVLNPLSS